MLWRLGGGTSGGADRKTKGQGVVSDDRGGTIPSLTGGAGPDERWAGLGKQRSRRDEAVGGKGRVADGAGRGDERRT